MSESRLRQLGPGKARYSLMSEDEADSDVSIIADPDASGTQPEDGDETTLTIQDGEDEDEEEEDLATGVDVGGQPATRAPLTRREKMVRVVSSIYWQGVVFLLIVLDVILLCIQMYAFYGTTGDSKDLSNDFGANSSLTDLSAAIVCILLAEVFIRLAVLGKHFWRDILNIFDLLVMIASFVMIVIVENRVAGGFLVAARVIRIVTRVLRVIIKVVQGKRHLNKAVRTVVTENKQRYTKNGWDLDLAFITDRVVVMSLPAWDYRSLYRNHIDDVARFFDTLYPEKYVVVNCCAESYANYPIMKFHDRVKRFYIEDHNTATLKQFLEACELMYEWMQDPSHIAVVHCKGGKGRSGSMICAYLLYSGVCTSGDEALELFAQKRTDPTKPGRMQGVETASQKRYVEYFSTIVRQGKCLPPRVRLLVTKLSVRLISPDNLQGTYQLAPFATITHNDGVPTTSLKLRKKNEEIDLMGLSAVEYDGPASVDIVNDVRMMVFLEDKNARNKSGRKREIYFFYFWFHTAFVSPGRPLILSKTEVDRNRKWKKSPFGKLKSLSVEVHFASL